VDFWSGFAIPQTVQCYVSFRRVADNSSTWLRPNSRVSFAVFCACCIHIGDDQKTRVPPVIHGLSVMGETPSTGVRTIPVCLVYKAEKEADLKCCFTQEAGAGAGDSPVRTGI